MRTRTKTRKTSTTCNCFSLLFLCDGYCSTSGIENRAFLPFFSSPAFWILWTSFCRPPFVKRPQNTVFPYTSTWASCQIIFTHLISPFRTFSLSLSFLSCLSHPHPVTLSPFIYSLCMYNVKCIERAHCVVYNAKTMHYNRVVCFCFGFLFHFSAPSWKRKYTMDFTTRAKIVEDEETEIVIVKSKAHLFSSNFINFGLETCYEILKGARK